MFKRVLWWYLFVGWGVCCLKGLPYARLKATSTPSHAIRSYKVQTNAFQGEIPYEISSVDQYPLVPTELLLPDTSIATLYGADNLGVILWTFVLYNGLYITRQRPVDILIPLIAKVIQQEHLQWYQDYKDGYASQKPPLVDFVTYAFFTTTGYFINTVVINSLDGDSFWGWSIAACLGIPSALFTLAKSKKQTREEALLNSQLEEEFNKFATSRLRRVQGREVFEDVLIDSFRRHYTPARLEKDVSYAILRRIVKKWVGYKPDKEKRIYKGLVFASLLQPEKVQIHINTAPAAKESSDTTHHGSDSTGSSSQSAGSDFIRS